MKCISIETFWISEKNWDSASYYCDILRWEILSYNEMIYDINYIRIIVFYLVEDGDIIVISCGGRYDLRSAVPCKPAAISRIMRDFFSNSNQIEIYFLAMVKLTECFTHFNFKISLLIHTQSIILLTKEKLKDAYVCCKWWKYLFTKFSIFSLFTANLFHDSGPCIQNSRPEFPKNWWKSATHI